MHQNSGRKRILNGLKQDECGAALIYVTMMLPVIVGFSLLAIDVGRVSILQSSLQNGADAIALAMAAELDRTSQAITRAEKAKDDIVKDNPALFTESFSKVDKDSISWRFLSSLPASDQSPITDDYTTSVAADARYVEVTVNPATYGTVFPAAFINAVSTITTSAKAVAGMEPGACNIVPMFICNPLEPTGNTDPYRTTELQDHVLTASKRRRLFELKAFPNSGQAQFSPGNFGYVETPLGSGARGLNDAISQAVPGACITLNGLTTKPGATNVTNAAFNVRFDMYEGAFKNTDSKIRPSLNNRKSYIPTVTGKKTDSCKPTEITDLYTNSAYTVTNPPPAGIGFPRDKCHVAGNCGTGAGGRIGGGDWNGMFELYMRANFGDPGLWPKKDAKTGEAFSTLAANLPSRYEVYRAEIAQSKVNSKGMGTPACYSNTTTPPNDQPDRRLIFAAIANCIAQPIGSGSTQVNAAAFGQFFLTEPVGTQGSVYAELVNIVKPGAGSGSNGVRITDNVQLYR